MHKHIRQTLLLGLGLGLNLFLPACTFKKILYDHLDSVAIYQIDSYVDLKADQKKALEGPVQANIAWIKQAKLPEAIELMEVLEKSAAARKFDQATDKLFYDRLEQWRGEAVERMLQPTADLLHSLDGKQIARLDKKMAEALEPLDQLMKEDPDDFDDELQDYIDDQVKKYKAWYGKWTPEQRELMVKTVLIDKSHLAEELLQRTRARQAFMSELKKGDRASLETFLKAWSRGDSAWLDTPFQEYQTASRARWRQFWTKLHESLSVEQWQHLEKRLHEVKQDLIDLHARPA